MAPAAGTIRAPAARIWKSVARTTAKRKRPQNVTVPTAARPRPSAMPVSVRSLSLSVIAVLAAILVLQYAQSVLIPVVLGVLLSYALESNGRLACAPPRSPGDRRGARRGDARRQHRGRCLHAQRRSRRDRRQCAGSGATHPRARRLAPTSEGDGPQPDAGGGQRDREDCRRRDHARRTRARRTRSGPARAGRSARVQSLRLPVDWRRGTGWISRPVLRDPVPGLFPARHRRSVQAQAREDRRPDARRRRG